MSNNIEKLKSLSRISKTEIEEDELRLHEDLRERGVNVGGVGGNNAYGALVYDKKELTIEIVNYLKSHYDVTIVSYGDYETNIILRR